MGRDQQVGRVLDSLEVPWELVTELTGNPGEVKTVRSSPGYLGLCSVEGAGGASCRAMGRSSTHHSVWVSLDCFLY